MQRIGLTGGIGCGKSRVARLFSHLGVPVLDADRITHELQQPGHIVHAAIVERFGPEILDPRGHLDRDALRQRIFANAEERQALEELIHPAVRATLEERLQTVPDSPPYAILVVPLLFEAGWDREVDQVIAVHCDRIEQIRRVMQRDDRSRPEVEAILSAQLSTEERRRRADHVIFNHDSTDTTELRNQVAELDRYLRSRNPQPRDR